MAMLLGVVRPSSGSYELLGHPASSVPRSRIGATLERPAFYPYLNGAANLRVVATARGLTSSRVPVVIDQLGLAAQAGRPVGAYSMGQLQRLALAAALLGEPDLLMLDEPTNGLDPEGIRLVRHLISELTGRGTTVFVSSHLLTEVERVCSECAVIVRGRVVSAGPIEKLRRHTVAVELGGPAPERILAAVRAFPKTVSATLDDELVSAELSSDQVAGLVRHVTGAGVDLTHVLRRRETLEEAFTRLTNAPAGRETT